MSFEMITRYDENEKKILVYPIGDIDIYTSPEFKEKVGDIYMKEKCDIVIDGDSLDYIDSTGLGVLLSILKETRANGHEIILKNLKPNVKKLFGITKLDEMFIIQGEENDR